MPANLKPQSLIRLHVKAEFKGEKPTFSPSVVRMDKALGTSKAVFCFFTMWMQETGITSCRSRNTRGTCYIQNTSGNKNTRKWESRGRAAAYLSVLEQHWGVETGVGVGDVQPAVVGHFLLQGTDVCWERRRRGAKTPLVLCALFNWIILSLLSFVFTHRVSSLHPEECLETTCGMSCCALWNSGEKKKERKMKQKSEDLELHV